MQKHNVTSIILIILLAIISAFTLFSFSVVNGLSSARFYKTTMAESGIYQAMPSILFEEMLEDEEVKRFLDTLPVESKGNIVNTIALVVEADWLQKEVEINLDRIEAFIKSDQDRLELPIDLTGRKVILETVVTDQLNGYLAQFPICTNQDLVNLQRNPDQVPTCLPQDFTVEKAYEQFGGKERLFDKVPDNLDLVQFMDEKQTSNVTAMGVTESLLEVRKLYKITQQLVLAGGVLLLIILGILFALHRERVENALLWLSIGIGAATAPSLAFAFGIRREFSNPSNYTGLDEATPSLTPIVRRIPETMGSAFDQLFYWIYLIGLIGFIVAVILFIVQYKLRQDQIKTP